MPQIYYRQGYPQGGSNDLDGLPLQDLKGGTQGFMAKHNFVERCLKRCQVERTRQAKCCGHIVEAITWEQLVEEPQPLLGKRCWKDKNLCFFRNIEFFFSRGGVVGKILAHKQLSWLSIRFAILLLLGEHSCHNYANANSSLIPDN